MGVSISEGGNIDLDAIVAGGDGFLDRIKAIKAAKAEHDASLDALNLGRDAAAAMRDAQMREEAAKQLYEATKVQAEQMLTDGHARAAEIVRQGQIDVDTMMVKAHADVAAIDAQVKDAHQVLSSWSENTKAEASGLLDRATATKAEADQQFVTNLKEAKNLAALQAEAKTEIDTAVQLQATLAARLDAIKAAAS